MDKPNAEILVCDECGSLVSPASANQHQDYHDALFELVEVLSEHFREIYSPEVANPQRVRK